MPPYRRPGLRAGLVLWLLGFVLAVLAGPAEAAPIRHRLPSGLTVITEENHESPVVSLQVWVRAGSAYEEPSEYGITHLIEHMIFKGSPQDPKGEMAGRIEGLGGEVNAYTTYDHTNYHVTVASRFAGEALSLLADAVVNASFDPAELAREKEVVIEEIRMGLDDPGRRFSQAVHAAAFGDHPYGRPIIGSEESVRALTREDILAYRDRWYRAPSVIVVAVGDFRGEELLPRIEAAFAGQPTLPAPEMTLKPVPPPAAPKVLVLREKVRQASLSLAWVVPGLPSPEVPTLDLAAAVLGEGETSRLWAELKEKRGLVDAAAATSYTPDQAGLFQVRARLDPAKVAQAWRPLLDEALSLAARPPRPTELQKARVGLAAEYRRRRQTMAGQASLLGYFEMFWGGFERAGEYLERYRTIGAGQVAETAAAHLLPAAVSLVIQLPEGAPAPDEDALARAAAELAQPPAPAPPAAGGEPATTATLPNGLTLVVQPRRAVELMNFSLVAPGGQAAETRDTAGLHDLWARALTRGSQNYGYEELAGRLESLAASLSPFSGKSACGLNGAFLAEDWEEGLRLLAEVWLRPTFPAEQLMRAKAEQAAAQRAQEDRPPLKAFLRFRELLYGDHPYGLNPLGSPENLARFTREDLLAAHERLRGPGGVVLAVVGAVDPAAVKERVTALFGGQAGRAERLAVPELAPLTAPRRLELKDDKAKQTQIVLGFAAPSAESPRRHAMSVLEAILGGMGGRLFGDLRDQRSLAYAVQPFFSPAEKAGVMGVYLGVGPGKEAPALAGLAEHLTRLREAEPSPEEMERARSYLVGGLAIGLQTYAAQASALAADVYFGRGVDYQRKLPEELLAVTARQVGEAARDYLDPAGQALLTLGP